jgi:hypothetical protein
MLGEVWAGLPQTRGDAGAARRRPRGGPRRAALVHQRHDRLRKTRAALGRSPKSLMRMFGPSGNPTAENLLAVIGLLQAETGVRLQVRAVADAA